MAIKEEILLGFIDEPISDYYTDTIDYTTNKLGGFPNWITKSNNIKKVIICKVCESVIPLLLQIYAPIKEKINHHRSLYIFACINPTCWGNVESWVCIKNQQLIKEGFSNVSSSYYDNDWCNDANNWECDKQDHKNLNEVSYSFDNQAASMISNISIVEENANEILNDTLADKLNVLPSAEIEPDENEMITIDSPIIPNRNLLSILQQKPSSINVHDKLIHFIPFFINAVKEKIEKDPLIDHANNLLMEYSRVTGDKNGFKMNVNIVQQSDEKYEKSIPLHGDKLFHMFLSRIKSNPDQIMRYCRNNSAPLFLYSDAEIPPKCKYCNGDVIFEIQILSTIINYLKLPNDNPRNKRENLDFGSAFIYTCKESCEKSEEGECIVLQCEKF